VFHHTPRKTDGETLNESPETLKSLRRFKVSASVSEAATSHLGLVSDKILNVSVSSRSRLRRSCAHPCRSTRIAVPKQIVCVLLDYNIALSATFVIGYCTVYSNFVLVNCHTTNNILM